MRVALDTNIPISALVVQLGRPAAIYGACHEGYFKLLTCTAQLGESRATLRMPAIACGENGLSHSFRWLTANSTTSGSLTLDAEASAESGTCPRGINWPGRPVYLREPGAG